MNILFLQTGGTIDKDYPRSQGGYAFEFGEPATLRILEQLDPSFEFEVDTVCQKDSQELTDLDREHLATRIRASSIDRVIVTHGTDTLLDTAYYLEHRVSDKLVILTRAMRPQRFSNSDAPVNLGVALGAASLLKSGVYVAMHGLVKPAPQMCRDPDTGKFQ